MTASAADWSAFPELVLHPERVLYRVHRNQNRPVHFCPDGSSRFDLTTVDGTDTCYRSRTGEATIEIPSHVTRNRETGGGSQPPTRSERHRRAE